MLPGKLLLLPILMRREGGCWVQWASTKSKFDLKYPIFRPYSLGLNYSQCDQKKLPLESFIICKLLQLHELVKINRPLIADFVTDDVSKQRVAQKQPSKNILNDN